MLYETLLIPQLCEEPNGTERHNSRLYYISESIKHRMYVQTKFCTLELTQIFIGKTNVHRHTADTGFSLPVML